MKKLIYVFILSVNLFAVDGATIASEANKYIGNPYVWGGTNLETGADCSGFVQSLYKLHDFGIPRTAHEQATNTDDCPNVPDLASTQLGDAIYFKNDAGHIHHVALVTGVSGSRPTITHAKGRKYGILRESISDKHVAETYIIKRFSDCDENRTEYENYAEDAIELSTGGSPEELLIDRTKDLVYIFIDPLCCCNLKILELFKDHTKNIAERTNPATDNIMKVLASNLETNDLKVKRLVNLKYANSIYSFYDLNKTQVEQLKKEREKPTMNGEGCVPLDFNKQEDKDYYLAMLSKFESGGRYDAQSENSSAYGRYQFITSTGAQYCKRVGNDCCARWHTSSLEGMECQDAMFVEFTKDNSKFIENKGFSINSCSVYLTHQLGMGGYLWLMGGKNPYGSFESLRNTVSNNTYGSYRNRAKVTGSEEELREIYTEFWSNKFGGDIMAETGNKVPLEDFSYATYELSKNIKKPIWFRRGILLELFRINRDYEFIYESIFQKYKSQILNKNRRIK